ncbi:hypothetical protein GCM10020219_021210 [Nonomuraea dietziae]
MMIACDCHALPNIGSVRLAMTEARKEAPTGPQVQKPNACALPTRGEKSRTRLAVIVMAAPSMNSMRQRTNISPPTVSTVASRKLQAAVTVRVGNQDRHPAPPVGQDPAESGRQPAHQHGEGGDEAVDLQRHVEVLAQQREDRGQRGLEVGHQACQHGDRQQADAPRADGIDGELADVERLHSNLRAVEGCSRTRF